MEEGGRSEPFASPKAVHESPSEGEGGSDSSGSYQTPSPLDPPCAKRQRVEQPDPDFDPDDEVSDRRYCTARIKSCNQIAF